MIQDSRNFITVLLIIDFVKGWGKTKRNLSSLAYKYMYGALSTVYRQLSSVSMTKALGVKNPTLNIIQLSQHKT